MSDSEGEVIELFERQQRDILSALNGMRESIEHLGRSLAGGLKTIALVPVSLGFGACFTWLFYEGKISEWAWMPLMLVLMSPYFSDGVRLVVRQFPINEPAKK
jgi:hypothetical protein